jgi:hypothetical protein
MEKKVYRTSGHGLVWDSRRNKVFYDFNTNHGIYETTDSDDVKYMETLGYKFDKILVDMEEDKVKEEIVETKIDEQVVEEEKVEEVIDNTVLPIPEPLSKEAVMKLLDDKDIKYKKNMKVETLQKLLDEAK